MNFLKTTICALIALTGAQFAYSQEYRISDPLPIDNAYKIGKLDNGMTYYIRKHTNPANRAEFFIVHNVGSLQENDNQRGLAHFLEHMAFNGTKNYPKKQLLNYFAGIGVKFGANINAYTSMDRTVYNLSAVPMVRSTVIDSALLVLHDWSYYISCEPSEIEAERGVIREEWRRGDDARTRMMKAFFKNEESGSRFAQRDVIGDTAVINNFVPPTLVNFYHKWYRPDLQAIVVIGDFDVADMEKRIIKIFSSIPKAVNPEVRESYTIPTNEKPNIGFFTDPESQVFTARLTTKIPLLSKEAKMTNEAVYQELYQNIFLEIFRDRVSTVAEKSDSSFKTAVPVYGALSYAMKTFTVSTIPFKKADLLKATKATLTEVERMKQHGAGKEEFAIAVDRVSRQLDKDYNRNKDPKSEDLVNAVVENFTRNTPLISPLDYYKTSKECLKRITLEDFNKFLPKFLTNENRVLTLVMPEKDKKLLPTKEQILKVYDEVANAQTEEFVAANKKGMEFKNTGLTPVPVQSLKKVTEKEIKIAGGKQLDSTVEMTLSNGAKIIWKENRTDKNNVNFYAFKKGGFALDKNVLDLKFLDNFLINYQVNGLNKQDLDKWKKGRNVDIKPGMSYRHSNISGSFVVKDSLDFFRLLNSYFTNISVDEKVFKNYSSRILKDISEPKKAHNIFADSVNTLKYTYNPNNQKFTADYIKGLTSQKVLDLYKSLYYNPTGYTFVFSGPMTAVQAKPLIEKYIATIAAGASDVNEKYVYKEPKLKTGDTQLRYLVTDQMSTKASIDREYFGKMEYNAINYLNAKVFSYIMSERLMASIREERGATYHVGAISDMYRYPENIITVTVEFDTDPKLVSELLDVVQDEFVKFAKNGPTEKEISEVKLYLEKRYQDKSKESFNWTSAIANGLQGNPVFQEDEEKLLNNITAKSLQNFSKNLIKSNNRMTFVFEPKL